MPGGHIPKDLLYGELACGKRPTGWLQLRNCDVMKPDMKTVDINRGLGEPGRQPAQVERTTDQTPQIRGGEADTSCHRETENSDSLNRLETAQMQPLQRTVPPTLASTDTDVGSPTKQTFRMLPMVNSD